MHIGTLERQDEDEVGSSKLAFPHW